MLRYDFSTKSLLRITTRNEIIKFNLGRNEDDYKFKIKDVSNEICKKNFLISSIDRSRIGNKVVFSASDIYGYYSLKKISKDLSRIYKINTSNRDDISEQLYRILESSSGYGIIRLDVKSFYESISYSDIMNKLKSDKLISAKSSNILFSLQSKINKGLPRGLSISPVLSEIFMRDIDYNIKNMDGVYYYARYVDDIVIITTKSVDDVMSGVDEIFRDGKLYFNSKFYKKDIPFLKEAKEDYWFDYLGYKFKMKPFEFDGHRKVLVGLSNDKIRKYKTRIVHSLLERSNARRNNKMAKDILIKRIEYLTGNYKLFSNSRRSGDLKGGVFYSNKLVNDPGVFLEISQFLRKGLSCNVNNFFGRSINKIPKIEKDYLNGFCFKEGFLTKVEHDFSKETVAEIKRCWKHKKHKRSK